MSTALKATSFGRVDATIGKAPSGDGVDISIVSGGTGVTLQVKDNGDVIAPGGVKVVGTVSGQLRAADLPADRFEVVPADLTTYPIGAHICMLWPRSTTDFLLRTRELPSVSPTYAIAHVGSGARSYFRSGSPAHNRIHLTGVWSARGSHVMQTDANPSVPTEVWCGCMFQRVA